MSFGRFFKAKRALTLILALVFCGSLVSIILIHSARADTVAQNRLPRSDLYDQWTPNTGSDRWDTVNDPVTSPDDSTTYVYATTNNAYQSMALPEFSINSESIEKVSITARCKRTAAGEASVLLNLRVTGNSYDSSPHALTTDWANYTSDWSINPDSSSAWLEPDVEDRTGASNPISYLGLRSSGVDGGEEIQCTQVYMSVYYTASTNYATYYVDSSITDTNVASATPDFTTYNPATFETTGGSASVYKTIADINALEDSPGLNPGDSVLFRKGQTWQEELTINRGGTPSNRVTISSFGSGNLPIIDGEDARNGITAGASAGGMIFSNLRIINGNNSCIAANYGQHTFDGLEIDSCYTGGNAAGDSIVTVTNSTFTNNTNEGFGMHVRGNATIDSSVFIDNVQGVNISMFAGANSTLDISNSYFSNITDEIAMGPNITTTVTKSRFVFQSTNSHGVVLQPGDTLSYSTFDISDAPATNDPFNLGAAGTLNVYNVTVYGGSGTNRGDITALTGAITNIYNSIFYNFWRAGYIYAGGEINAYNCVFYDISIKSLTTNENEITADPQFADAANGDFRLLPASIGIGSGVDVGLTEDYLSNPVPVNTIPDIGAYEFQAPSSPSSLSQYKTDNSTVISSGGYTNESQALLKFTVAADNASDTFVPEIEIREVGTPFSNTATHTGGAMAYTGTPVNDYITVTGLTDGTSYHWQVRAQNSVGYSDWVAGGGSPDLISDQSKPTFANLPGESNSINVTEGQTVTTNPYIIKVKPADNVQVSYVEFYVDSTLLCTDGSADAQGIYECAWDTATYQSDIEVIAYDVAGNQSIALTRSATVDLSTPSTPSSATDNSEQTETISESTDLDKSVKENTLSNLDSSPADEQNARSSVWSYWVIGLLFVAGLIIVYKRYKDQE